MTINSISPYLRGLAIAGVFVENYFSWIGVKAPGPGLAWLIRYLEFFGASLVHIFFVLSGYGLTIKYQACSEFPWKAYAANRFAMIVVPYWIAVAATYLFINILNGYDPVTFTDQFRPPDLLSYILFLRNFNASSWDLNPTLWFMQAIFGLYVLFPFLSALQKKHGLKSVLLAAALLVCVSRLVYVISGLPIDRGSGFFLFYTLEFAIGMALAAKPAISAGISNGSVSAWCLMIAFAGYAVSYLLKIKIGIPANLHDVFTCIGSFALGIFSYQVLAFLRFEKIERVIGSIGKLAFVIYLLHAPPIQHLIKPLLKRYYDNSQGIFEVCAILIVYFSIIMLVSKPLARYLLALSSKIEAYLSKSA